MTGSVRNEIIPGATSTALVLRDRLSQDEWEHVGEKLGEMARASCWWIGDWINYGEDAGYISREKYERAVELTGLARQTLRTYAYVCRQYESLTRINDSSFKAHRLALGNGKPPEKPFVYEITTERQRQIAEKAKERVERTVGSCNALARADEYLKIEVALAVAEPDEVEGWDSAFAEAVSSLRRLRMRLKGGR